MATLPLTVLTTAAAAQYLQNDGLETLGLTTVTLSPRWSTTDPQPADFNVAALTINIADTALVAPFRGMLAGTFVPAIGYLNAAITAAATTITLQSGDGNNFPTPTGGGSIVLELSSGSTREMVLCTNRAGDTLTIQRGYDGTAPQAFAAADAVRLRVGRNNASMQFSGADGAPLNTPCTVFRFHPQAVLRLERLMIGRFGTDVLPVPWYMVVRNAPFFETDQFFDANDVLPVGGPVSFHDSRGLIIDPVYVAAIFESLLNWLVALQPVTPPMALNQTGGVSKFSALANGTLLHVVNLHGANFQPILENLVLADPDGSNPAPVDSSQPFALPAGKQIQAQQFAPGAGRLRWGWATNGMLSRTSLAPPTLMNPLARQFYRVCAVDTSWSLIGNRTDQPVFGVPPADPRMAELLPEVRDQVVIDYLADAPDTLGEATRLLSSGPNAAFRMAVSMQLDPVMNTPPTAGAAAHWPLFPGPTPNPPGGFPAVPQRPTAQNVTAAWAAPGSKDVVVTLTNIALLDEHVRLYPQQFVPIRAIGEEPSFVRGDGGANIAASNPVSVLLINPFNRTAAQSRPDPAVLPIDIVITSPAGNQRMFGAVPVTVLNQAPALPQTPFAGAGSLGAVPLDLRGISPAPLFGIPMPAPPPPLPANASYIDMAMNLAAEPQPRQAPRLPTMARFETLAVAGDTGGPNGTLLWDAVVTGARWRPESRSALHSQGNPGNPAGPDIHAAGVRVTGALAYDVAYAALRRAQPMYPWPAAPDDWYPGWVVFSAGDNFNVPDDSANVANTGIGALLRTVATGCESSLLNGRQAPQPGFTVEEYIENLVEDLQLGTVDVDIPNEPRLQQEIRREILVANHGLRDAQYALVRAIREARELIYIESPQFARTADNSKAPKAPPDNTAVELVSYIAARLVEAPNLKVIICTPRLSDFDHSFENWGRQHYAARKLAVSDLLAVAPDRVAVFHPVGFPGRPAYIRTTSVIVDDVWSLVGATHFRRRGMTFDGSAAIVSFDRQLESGYSKKVRAYRRSLMANKIGVTAPAMNQSASGDWIRLERPHSAFSLVQDLLGQGGLGRIQPLWPGPSDQLVEKADLDVADPDGSLLENFEFMTTMAGILDTLGR